MHLNHMVIKSHNQLGISRIDRITDKQRKNLILIMESNRALGYEINALLKENNLILEASLEPDYEKPIRTHLVGHDIFFDFKNEVPFIGFTEIKLNPDYHYSVLSCQVMDPGLIKIVLKYYSMRKRKNNYKS